MTKLPPTGLRSVSVKRVTGRLQENRSTGPPVDSKKTGRPLWPVDSKISGRPLCRSTGLQNFRLLMDCRPVSGESTQQPKIHSKALDHPTMIQNNPKTYTRLVRMLEHQQNRVSTNMTISQVINLKR